LIDLFAKYAMRLWSFLDIAMVGRVLLTWLKHFKDIQKMVSLKFRRSQI